MDSGKGKGHAFHGLPKLKGFPAIPLFLLFCRKTDSLGETACLETVGSSDGDGSEARNFPKGNRVPAADQYNWKLSRQTVEEGSAFARQMGFFWVMGKVGESSVVIEQK